MIEPNRPAVKDPSLARIWAAFDQQRAERRRERIAQRQAEAEQRRLEAEQAAAEAEEKQTRRARKRRRLVLDSDEEEEDSDEAMEGEAAEDAGSVRLVLPAQQPGKSMRRETVNSSSSSAAAAEAEKKAAAQLNAEERRRARRRPVVLPKFSISAMPSLEPLLKGMARSAPAPAEVSPGTQEDTKMSDDPSSDTEAALLQPPASDSLPEWKVFRSALSQTHSWESLTDLPEQKLVVAPYVVRLHHH